MRWALKSLTCTAAAVLIAGAGLLHPAAHSPHYQPLLTGADVPVDVDNIFSRACQDCHSNKTEWPWYAQFPPMSKLIAQDVERGRTFMNLSNWPSYSKGQKLGFLAAMSSAATGREMPPMRYTLIHGDARLSVQERNRIADWAKQEAARIQSVKQHR
jgi:hypothetical protein